ncbi:hypothetical protein SASPL_104536 [Salvia splendens]|uniref:ALOG domain-containing protein n=1 Tax=Salvia splendens TaxID=180675 RepID=A0A8X9A8I1_SALSN|nr:hypothetical protein SASPL_104536 [Salvia splendens]
MSDSSYGNQKLAAPSSLRCYKSQKQRDWNTFGQYLKNHSSRCNGSHPRIPMLLDQFGKIKFHGEMPLPKSLLRVRALHVLTCQSKPLTSLHPPPPPPPPPPADTFLVDKAVSILKYHHPSLLNPLIPQFTPAAASSLLLQSQNDQTLILKFLTWAREFPFFATHLQCLCLSIHILTRFKLYKTAQTLAEQAALTFPADQRSDSVFSCLVDTYQLCNSSSAVVDLMVKALSNLKQIDRALNFVNLATNHGFQPSVLSYNSILEAIIRSKASGFGQGLVPNEVTYNTLINGFCKEGNFHQALVLHAEMVRNGLSPTVVTYTSLINSMCKARNLRRAMEFFDQLQIRGLNPNEKTYTTLIDGFCQQGFMDEAYRFLNEMINRGFSPSIVTYNALINGHCVAGRIDNGMEVIKDMTAKGVSPDVVSYSTIISGFSRDSRLDEAFQMKEEMVKKGIFPDAVTYSSLMQGLCAERRLTDAREMFEDMWRLGSQPDKCTYTTLINACCAEDDMESAMYLHNEMINKGVLPDVVTYSVLINGLNKQVRSKEAKRLLFKLFYEEHVPSDVTYDLLIEGCSSIEFQSSVALMKGFCLKGLMNKADRVFEEMLHSNHKPSEAVYNVLVHGHCKAGNLQKAIDLYMEMVQLELVPHAVTIIALARELHKVGWTEELNQILQDTLKSCKVIDGDRAKVLLEVNYKEGNMDNVFHILQEMSKDGLLPNDFKTA